MMINPPDPPSYIQQERILFVWNSLKSVEGIKAQDRYVVLAQSLGSMVLRNSLASTLAFLKSKSSKSVEHRTMYSHIGSWLFQYVYTQSRDTDILTTVISSTSIQFMRASDEVMTLATYMRRFSEALYGDLRGIEISDEATEESYDEDIQG